VVEMLDALIFAGRRVFGVWHRRTTMQYDALPFIIIIILAVRRYTIKNRPSRSIKSNTKQLTENKTSLKHD